jgi:hypothetical protein
VSGEIQARLRTSNAQAVYRILKILLTWNLVNDRNGFESTLSFGNRAVVKGPQLN